ncbi:uncharacterized protein LOC114322723 isoform X2 [Camellia sinensis]|uniref:uncharacterized protein LOC114322723 isoform X2 n=1 Tax=Camellia sinensis TaxID=4442 RepID=UPI001036E4B5|nr:uncharacterized protein LOC114322723 isoform X2 [Camellia sinensis]
MTVLPLFHFVYLVFTPAFMSNIDGDISRPTLPQGVVATAVQLHQTVKMKMTLRSRLDHSRSSDLKRKRNQETTIVRQGKQKSSPSSDDPPNCRLHGLVYVHCDINTTRPYVCLWVRALCGQDFSVRQKSRTCVLPMPSWSAMCQLDWVV